MYVDMACIVMYDNISIARNKTVNENIVLCYTVQDEDRFPCKSSGLWFTWIISYDRYGLHYNVLLGHIIGCFTRNKRVNDKLHAYALVWKKTGLHANFQVHWCYS